MVEMAVAASNVNDAPRLSFFFLFFFVPSDERWRAMSKRKAETTVPWCIDLQGNEKVDKLAKNVTFFGVT